MNVIVVGLGSMGRRRVRLLKKYDESIKIIGVDLSEERRNSAESEFNIETKDSLEKACGFYDCEAVFVSTSPLSHADIINECLNNDLHVFSEINLVLDRYDENIALSKQKNKVLFLSSTFLYRKEVNYIKSKVKETNEPLSYIYHVGQYLPDWHPWENYKSFFVGNARTNGCRELMAIEFPWITNVFGNIIDFKSIKGKHSKLDLDYPDTYHILVEHSNNHKGMIEIDIVSRKAERRLEVFGENLFLSWHGTPESLSEYNINEKKFELIDLYSEYQRKLEYEKFIIEDAYYSEIVEFFEIINNLTVPRYSFEKDKTILNLIEQIEFDRF